MRTTRIILVVSGVLFPFLVRLLRGPDWLQQYFGESGVGLILCIIIFNAITWGSLLWLSLLFRNVVTFLIPCMLSYGYLAIAHFQLDLVAHEGAILQLIWIPLFSLAFVVLGGGIGLLIDQKMNRIETR